MNHAADENTDFLKILQEFFEYYMSLDKNAKDDAASVSHKEMEQLVDKALDGLSFYSYLHKKILEKGFRTDADFYNYIGMLRQTFGKMKKRDANVSREHALLIAVGLGLDYDEAVEFLSYAGHTFRHSDMREQVISYVMKTRKYDLMLMEEILMVFGLEPLTDI